MGIEISLIAVDNDEYLLVDLKDGKARQASDFGYQ